jgi:hypothetical protein
MKYINKIIEFFKYVTQTSNWLLHIILGIGIGNMLLCYVRNTFLQLIIAVLFTTVIAGLLEKGQSIVLKVKPDIRDVIATGILGGFISFLINITFYGIHFDTAKIENKEFLSIIFYSGVILVIYSIIHWTIIQFIKLKKENK